MGRNTEKHYACQDADVQRIALLEAPSVLGWDASRDIARYGLGLIRRRRLTPLVP